MLLPPPPPPLLLLLLLALSGCAGAGVFLQAAVAQAAPPAPQILGGSVLSSGPNEPALCSLGDVDGDGVPDLGIGHPRDDGDRGSFAVRFLHRNGTAKAEQAISRTQGGFVGPLATDDFFGCSCALLGVNLTGSGRPVVAVGARKDDTGAAADTGAVWLFELEPNGFVASGTEVKIADGLNGMPSSLVSGDRFGASVAPLLGLEGAAAGDPVLAVGANAFDVGGGVFLLWLDLPNSLNVTQVQTISNLEGGANFTSGAFGGYALAPLGDLDGDGVEELAVAAAFDAEFGNARGAVHVLFLHRNGTVRADTKLASGIGGVPDGVIANVDLFGASVAGVDVNQDGHRDLLVGAPSTNANNRPGKIFVLPLQADGTVFPNATLLLTPADDPVMGSVLRIGMAVAWLGDLDPTDGLGVDVVVGARNEMVVVNMNVTEPPMVTTTGAATTGAATTGAMTTGVTTASPPPPPSTPATTGSFPLDPPDTGSSESGVDTVTLVLVLVGVAVCVALLLLCGFLALRQRKRQRQEEEEEAEQERAREEEEATAAAPPSRADRERRKRRERAREKQASHRYHNVLGDSNSGSSTSSSSTSDDDNRIELEASLSSSLSPKNTIVYSDLRRRAKLAEGNFGEVWKGEWKRQHCVIKTLKDVSDEARAELLREAKQLSELRAAPTLCAFYGVAMGDGSPAQPPCVVLEFIPGGNLESILQDHKKYRLTTRDILTLSADLAAGMEVLHDSNILHLDLAARNFLVVGHNPLTLRITDFGLSRTLPRGEDGVPSEGTLMPLRWVDPVAFFPGGMFTKGSDVWSFGVCMVEIISRGEPWPEHDTNEGVIQSLIDGKIPSRPKRGPHTRIDRSFVDDIYTQVMKPCFSKLPAARPSFATLNDDLSNLLEARDSSSSDDADSSGSWDEVDARVDSARAEAAYAHQYGLSPSVLRSGKDLDSADAEAYARAWDIQPSRHHTTTPAEDADALDDQDEVDQTSFASSDSDSDTSESSSSSSSASASSSSSSSESSSSSSSSSS